MVSGAEHQLGTRGTGSWQLHSPLSVGTAHVCAACWVLQAAEADAEFLAHVGRWERAVTLAERLTERQQEQPSACAGGG
jgi:hypothetical protein